MILGRVVLIEGLGSKARMWDGKEKADSEKAIVDIFNEECLRVTFLKGTMTDKSSVHKPKFQRKLDFGKNRIKTALSTLKTP